MLKLKDALSVLHESVALSTDSELKKALELIIYAQDLDSRESDTLRAAFKHGPLFDGYVPSKTGRDSLIGKGLMCKVVVKGQDGQNAVTQAGYWVHKLIEAGV